MIFTTSWDDGSIYDYKLLQLLKPLGIKGTLYISKESKYRSLTDNDVKFLSDYFEIGSHSLSHPNLTTLNKVNAELEILNSKIYLEKITGKQCKIFGYPYGVFNDKTKEIVKRNGYIGARIVNQDFCEGSILDNFHLPTTIQVCKHTKKLTRELNIKPSNQNSLSSQFLKDIQTFKLNANNEYSWFGLAEYIFNVVKNQDGVFHIWGHSWEIEEQNLWGELEEFLKLIKKNHKVQFLTNSELFWK